jgi:hypothetical protein
MPYLDANTIFWTLSCAAGAVIFFLVLWYHMTR